MPRGSAAYMLAIVVALMFLIGSMLLTVVDPTVQGLFNSMFWNSSTAQGTDLLTWVQDLWLFAPVAILIGILIEVFVVTRQPT